MRNKRSGRRTPRLGQHFLTGQWVARRLVEAVEVRGNETILEIGPGKGALTKELLKTGARVMAVEKDKGLIDELRHTLAEEISSGALTIIAADIRDISPKKLSLKRYVLAANIPYYITGEIIRTFLTADPQPRALALLVQKEVAQRIVARDGKESILSISVKAYGTPRIVANVSRGNFSPPPSVDSAVLLITDVSRNFFLDIDEKHFFRVVKIGFSSKRKLLSGNLKKLVAPKTIARAFHVCAIPANIRAEDLQLDAWKSLARHLIAG